MSPGGFEPTIPASERPQTYALDRAANRDRQLYVWPTKFPWDRFGYKNN